MHVPDLQGKTALVTGGGRGIGRATALTLAACGARVVVTARSQTQIEAVAQEIQAGGGHAQAMACDVSREDLVHALFDATGPVDILVNNAGIIQPIAPVMEIDLAAWRQNLAINLDGVFLTCHHALPAMVERGWGRIVNVSSGAARGSVSSWSAYSAAKGGLEAFTKVLALEVGDRGIRVNAIRPGIIDTEMQVEIRGSSEARFGRENLARFKGYQERGLLRRPEDPAKLILWLAGPEADEVNGEVLILDDPEVAARVGLEPMGR